MTTFIKAKYHPNIKVAEFIADDGRHLLRSGGSLQWRICNGGDLSSPVTDGVPTPKKTKGYIGFAKPGTSEHHFFIFPDYETGRAQLKASLLRKYGTRSVSAMVEAYAPANDNNDTGKYLEDLCSLSGVTARAVIGEFSTTQLDSVMDAIERLEGYHQNVETRKEKWVTVSHIQATDGTRPIAGEEIVVRAAGKETTHKSNDVGRFPPIVHGVGTTEVHHKTIDGELRKVGELPADKGQHLSLVTKVAEYFGTAGPVVPPPNPIKNKQPVQYPVQPGDDLKKIAARFKADPKTIKKDNRLVKDRVIPGQVLGIHSPPVTVAAAKPKKAAPKAKKAISPSNSAVPAAAAAKTTGPKPSPAAGAQTIAARSKEGQGEPLALLVPEEGVAPWMKYAIAEAQKFRGAEEDEIEDTRNYHKEIGDGLKTLVGTANAWCAAFDSWCLMKAGYPIQNPKESGFVDLKAIKMRADGFIHVHKKGQSMIPNPLYLKIDEPVYGAIAIVANTGGHGHHAGFVYGDVSDDYICVLGGNQDDRIKFSPFIKVEQVKVKTVVKKGKTTKKTIRSDHMEYFIPVAYKDAYEKQNKILEKVNVDKLNESIGISKPKASTSPTTR